MTSRKCKTDRSIRSANDNAPGVAPAPPPPRTYSRTPEELATLHGVISALAQMVANDLSATTLCSEEA
jgi:hypothetical protein